MDYGIDKICKPPEIAKNNNMIYDDCGKQKRHTKTT